MGIYMKFTNATKTNILVNQTIKGNGKVFFLFFVGRATVLGVSRKR